MTGKSVQLLQYALILLMLTACGRDDLPAKPPAVVKTRTVILENQEALDVYSGHVRSRYESRLSFQVGGKIKKRHVNLGQAVKAGDRLMELDPKDIEESVRRDAARLEAASVALALARADYQRYDNLRKAGTVSQSVYDQYKTALEAAEQTLLQAEAQCNQSLHALEYATLIADADGFISLVEAEAGQVASAGQTMMTLVWDEDWEVEIDVPENKISGLSLGQKALVEFWALPELTIGGHIREIAPVADQMTRTFLIRVVLDSRPPEIRLGMTAGVRLSAAAEKPPEARLPTAAIHQTGEQSCVWLVKEGTLVSKPVVLGGYIGNQVRVLDGLVDGDVVVVAGVHKLSDGQKVRLMADSRTGRSGTGEIL
jgi:RND family efflux transporter MFP subunit